MAEFGHYTMCLAWVLCLLGMGAGAFAGIRGSTAWFLTARSATILVAVSTCLVLFALGHAFYHSDFALQYVWQYSNRAMPPVYRIAAIWGGMDGSMLLWCGMLAISAGIVAWRSVSYPRALMPWVLVVLNSASCFFLTVTVFLTNPFRYLHAGYIPLDGRGLNPLLQNPLMAIHPPLLYLGFTTLAVPYAFCMGALASKQLSNEWIRLTRSWTLIAWGFLTVGIVLGGYWAYLELGWGGFWAWDPVENASFLPWLTATAFLHSVMIQERKNMLKTWNVWLIVLTYGLTVFGTFLTRSGVVQSVHAFAETDVGWVFLLYLGILFGTALVLTLMRRSELRSERHIESFFSREAAFLLNNLVLLSICFATIWGVLFPILSEAVTGTKQTVGPPFFNAVNVPLFLGLIFLMGIGPLIAWRRANLHNLQKSFVLPFVTALLLSGILVWAGVNEFYPVLAYGLCWFVLMTIFGELHRGTKTVRAVQSQEQVGYVSGLRALLRRHRTKYGGHLVHLGVLVATIGITASMAHKYEREFSLDVGEKTQIGRFQIELTGIEVEKTRNYESIRAVTSIYDAKSGELLRVLEPEKRLYVISQEPTTEVALMSSLREDFYLVFAGTLEDGKRAAMKVFINPLQVWLWYGALVTMLGTIIVILPRSSAQKGVQLASAQELA